MILASLS